MTTDLPEHVDREVQRILDAAARRMFAEGYRQGPDGQLIKPGGGKQRKEHEGKEES